MTLLLLQRHTATTLPVKAGGRLMKRVWTIFKPTWIGLAWVRAVEELVEEVAESKMSMTSSERWWMIFIGPLAVDWGTPTCQACTLRSGRASPRPISRPRGGPDCYLSFRNVPRMSVPALLFLQAGSESRCAVGVPRHAAGSNISHTHHSDSHPHVSRTPCTRTHSTPPLCLWSIPEHTTLRAGRGWASHLAQWLDQPCLPPFFVTPRWRRCLITTCATFRRPYSHPTSLGAHPTTRTLYISHASAVAAPAYSDADSRFVHAYSYYSFPCPHHRPGPSTSYYSSCL